MSVTGIEDILPMERDNTLSLIFRCHCSFINKLIFPKIELDFILLSYVKQTDLKLKYCLK